MELSALASSSFLRKKSSIWLKSDCICEVFSFKKIFNFFLQQPPGFIKMPFGSAGGNAKNTAYLFVLIALQNKEVKNQSRVLRQRVHQLHDVIPRKLVIDLRQHRQYIFRGIVNINCFEF